MEEAKDRLSDKKKTGKTYNIYQKSLWNPNHFIILSILFSLLPASVLFSLNYGRLGFIKKRNIILSISILIFLSAFLIVSYLGTGTAGTLFVVFNAGLGIYMRNSQIGLYKDHINNGGEKASYILPTLLSIFLVGCFIALFIHYANIPENKITFNGSDLYYTNNVNINEVNKLGQFLVNYQIFSESKHLVVKIDKISDLYIFSIMISNQYVNDPEINTVLKSLGKNISVNVFNNSKIEVEMCDNKFNPLKTIPYNELK